MEHSEFGVTECWRGECDGGLGDWLLSNQAPRLRCLGPSRQTVTRWRDRRVGPPCGPWAAELTSCCAVAGVDLAASFTAGFRELQVVRTPVSMMILRLFCPKCAYDAAKEKELRGFSHICIDVPMPVSQPRDDGKYRIQCAAGHTSEITVDNIKFELLFELGLNALVDGYPREAVSSFTSALERFYEFYWHVVAELYAIPREQAAAAWKVAVKQSERQLGMYITASLLLTKQCPALLDPARDVRFRNNVTHAGYIPDRQEAINFGDVVLRQINEPLASLRVLAPDALIVTYERSSPAQRDKQSQGTEPSTIEWNDDEDHSGIVNILTAVDVRHPALAPGDWRRGGVEAQFRRILREREVHRLILADEGEGNSSPLSTAPEQP